jgi:type II secretory pathway component PulM
VNQWWQQRADREKWFLSWGAAATLLALSWALVWQPLTQQQKTLQSRVTAQQQTLAKLLQAQELRSNAGSRASLQVASNGTAGSDRDVSLSIVVDRGMRMAGLAAAIRSIQPVGDTSVTVTLEQASFDRLVAWLEQTATEQGVSINEANVDRGVSQGAVNARLTLLRKP